jgi:hypothetical protein
MTADISSSVAEKAVCWCDGRKNRRSLVMGRRFTCAGSEFPSKPTRGSYLQPSLSIQSGWDGSFIDTGPGGIGLSRKRIPQAKRFVTDDFLL